jgi:hypothetical protein
MLVLANVPATSSRVNHEGYCGISGEYLDTAPGAQSSSSARIMFQGRTDHLAELELCAPEVSNRI